MLKEDFWNWKPREELRAETWREVLVPEESLLTTATCIMSGLHCVATFASNTIMMTKESEKRNESDFVWLKTRLCTLQNKSLTAIKPSSVNNYPRSLRATGPIVLRWNQASCSTFTRCVREAQNTSLKAVSCYRVVRVRLVVCRKFSGPRVGSIFTQRFGVVVGLRGLCAVCSQERRCGDKDDEVSPVQWNGGFLQV